MGTESQDHASRIFPPAFIFVGGLTIGLLVQLVYPVQVLPNPFATGIALLLITVSGPLAILAVRSFSRAKTTYLFGKPASALVTDGPYRFSRNPGYVSLTMLFASVGFLFNSLWALIMIVPAVIVVHFGVIKREERYLEAKFGDEYLAYKMAVRRWI